VAGDGRFMQGRALRDACGNLVRVIDFIDGEDLLQRLVRVQVPHESYFRSAFPPLLARVGGLLSGVCRRHAAGLCHGDIRNDHILEERNGRRRAWIDVDLAECAAIEGWPWCDARSSAPEIDVTTHNELA
jgi:tRNA A-37 threonylcarbamoyl transferase component Bud32